ncbi:hypothetical protein ACM25N_18400 [Roseovarius sp. C7]|uniref:hypothetical protein n=1 Tax=Roseovarius sp. C7 TaxID=3398643 RepID=UPI0039F713C6
MTKTLTALTAAALMIPATSTFAQDSLMAIGLSGDKMLHKINTATATVTSPLKSRASTACWASTCAPRTAD